MVFYLISSDQLNKIFYITSLDYSNIMILFSIYFNDHYNFIFCYIILLHHSPILNLFFLPYHKLTFYYSIAIYLIASGKLNKTFHIINFDYSNMMVLFLIIFDDYFNLCIFYYFLILFLNYSIDYYSHFLILFDYFMKLHLVDSDIYYEKNTTIYDCFIISHLSHSHVCTNRFIYHHYCRKLTLPNHMRIINHYDKIKYALSHCSRKVIRDGQFYAYRHYRRG